MGLAQAGPLELQPITRVKQSGIDKVGERDPPDIREGGRPWPFALPAALAPFFQVRPLGAERGVGAVAGVDPGGVGQAAEQLGRHVVEQ